MSLLKRLEKHIVRIILTHYYDPDDIKEITGKDILDVINLKEGELDILDGSRTVFYFQLLKLMVQGGHSKGFKQTKKYSDGKKIENIEDLFFEYLRFDQRD